VEETEPTSTTKTEIRTCPKYFKKLGIFLPRQQSDFLSSSNLCHSRWLVLAWSIHKPIHKETDMGTILIIILILLLIGGLPVFPHSRSWGYGPSGIIGVVLVVLLILLLLGRI
jgi:hypothetical protein